MNILQNKVLFSFLRNLYRTANVCFNVVFRIFILPSPYFNQYIFVDPNSISKKTILKANKFRDCGRIKNGDWDFKLIDFKSDYPYYRSLKASLIDGEPWEETQLYKTGLQKLKRGETAFGARSETELKERFNYIAKLYNEIKEKGYRNPKSLTFKGFSDEVSIHIGRDGNLIFHDGGHRLSIAQLLNLKSIPVQVTFRHKQWNNLRTKLMKETKKVSVKFNHPRSGFH